MQYNKEIKKSYHNKKQNVEINNNSNNNSDKKIDNSDKK